MFNITGVEKRSKGYFLLSPGKVGVLVTDDSVEHIFPSHVNSENMSKMPVGP